MITLIAGLTKSICGIDWRWLPARSHKPFYVGSSPASATKKCRKEVILRLEQLNWVQWVAGSNPAFRCKAIVVH